MCSTWRRAMATRAPSTGSTSRTSSRSKRTSAGSTITASMKATGPSSGRASMDDCLLCAADRVTPWLHEDDECWIAECLVCRTPMIVWRSHGLPDPDLEASLLEQLERVAGARYG